MGQETKIEWCDHTFNPWMGCSKVHTGCANCYAESLVEKRYGRAKWGPSGTRSVTSDDNWQKPLAWNRAAEKAGVRAKVFCASLSDLLEDWGGQGVYNHKGQLILESYLGDARDTFDGTIEEWNDYTDKQGWHAIELDKILIDVFSLIRATPWLDWLVLTKRPQNIRRKIPFQGKWDNLWLGTSVSDQATADELIPELQKCHDLSPVLFVSYEPAIGAVQFDKFLNDRLDWIIIGGESGPNARPFNTDWCLPILDLCNYLNTPVFVKQLGSNVISSTLCGGILLDEFKHKKAGDPDEWPEVLRVRQFPASPFQHLKVTNDATSHN